MIRVFNNLKARGVHDILLVVIDGLKEMPKALAAVFPATKLQTGIVHLISNSLDYAGWKESKLEAQTLRAIYVAVTDSIRSRDKSCAPPYP